MTHVPPRLDSEKKSGEDEIHTEFLKRALTTTHCKFLLFPQVSVAFCSIPRLVVLCGHGLRGKQRPEFFWDMGNVCGFGVFLFFIRALPNEPSHHPVTPTFSQTAFRFNSFSVIAFCLHHPGSSASDQLEGKWQCVK